MELARNNGQARWADTLTALHAPAPQAREGELGVASRCEQHTDCLSTQASFLPHLLIPPLLANTAVGFALFEAYSLTEAKLLDRRASSAKEAHGVEVSKRPKFTPLHIVAASGLVAGAAQCIVSAPLDNVRIILSSEVGKRKVSARTISWRAVARAAVLPFAPAIAREKLVRGGPASQAKKRSLLGGLKTINTSAETRREWEKRWKRLRGGIHGAGLLMSLARDSVGE